MSERRHPTQTAPALPPGLPGGDLIAAGIAALRQGDFSIEALLVCVGARRLRRAGLDVPDAPGRPDEPELALHAAICAAGPADAHARYNALLRRLVSFERALERHRTRSR